MVCGATTSCYSNITRVLLSDSIHRVPSRNVVGRGVFDFCTDQFTCDALALALIKLSCECGELGVCGLMHVCMLPTRMICLHARIILTYARHVLGICHMCAWLAQLRCTLQQCALFAYSIMYLDISALPTEVVDDVACAICHMCCYDTI